MSLIANISVKNQKRIAITLIATVISYLIFRTTRQIIVRRKLKDSIVDLNIDIYTLFNPTRWNVKEPSISDVLARQKANKINDSRGMFVDDITTVISVFSGLKNQGDVSLIAHQYESLIGRDLVQDIENMFASRDAERSILYNALSKLD